MRIDIGTRYLSLAGMGRQLGETVRSALRGLQGARRQWLSRSGAPPPPDPAHPFQRADVQRELERLDQQRTGKVPLDPELSGVKLELRIFDLGRVLHEITPLVDPMPRTREELHRVERTINWMSIRETRSHFFRGVCVRALLQITEAKRTAR